MCIPTYLLTYFLPAQWLVRRRCRFPSSLLLFSRRPSPVHPSRPAARDWCTVIIDHGPYYSCPSLFARDTPIRPALERREKRLERRRRPRPYSLNS